MNSTALVIKRVLAVGLLVAVAASAAWAQPVTVVDGSSNVTVPVYPGPFSPPPGYTVLGSTGIQTASVVVDDSPTEVAFDEYAVTTPLNPFNTKTADGVTFVFAVAAFSNIGPGTFSGLGGFTGYQTAIEGCDPLTAVGAGSAATCSHSAGTVSRAGGSLTFGGIQLSPGTIDGVSGDISYAYAIFDSAKFGYHVPSIVIIPEMGLVIAMAVIGGIESLSGAVIGAVLVYVLSASSGDPLATLRTSTARRSARVKHRCSRNYQSRPVRNRTPARSWGAGRIWECCAARWRRCPWKSARCWC